MKKHQFIITKVLTVCLLLPFFQAHSQTYNNETQEKIRKVEDGLFSEKPEENGQSWNIEKRMSHYQIHGLSMAVIKDYKIEWVKAYGLADQETKRAVTTETLFQAASISKSINGLGVLKLAQQNKLDIDADINNYLITWKFPYDSVSKNKKISIANLLSHSAGLTIHGFPGYANGDILPAIPDILDGKKPANTHAVRSQFEPGLKTQYSGGGTTISQLIVADISGKPYAKYMWENVLEPLGMANSTYEQPPVNKKATQLATGYKIDGTEITGKYHIYPEQAAAGLWTNPTDMARYIIDTQLSLIGKSDKVLSQEMTKLRLTPFIGKNNALGVFIATFGAGSGFAHGGSNAGFRCQYYGSLEGGNGIVVMVNSDNGAILREIINSVVKVYGW